MLANAQVATGPQAELGPETNLTEALSKAIPYERFEAAFREQGEAYRQAEPFSYCQVDNLFDPEVLDRVLDEFPKPGDRKWLDYTTGHERKSTSRGVADLGGFTRFLMSELNGPRFLAMLEDLTGLKGLLPDPLYHGAGLHEVPTGGFLNVHCDWTRHPLLPMNRVLNLIVYLNRNWDPAWGGELELWDLETKEKRVALAPLFNRTVVFSTTSKDLHGHPTPLACPPEVTRKSISVYYWMPGEREEEGGGLQFYDGLGVSSAARSKAAVKNLALQLTPPLFTETARMIRRNLRG